MSELEGLLDAIRERPDEDLPRFALADWCMEQPDAESQARGEFIQLRCQAARLRPDDPARRPLELRTRQLREQHEQQWLGPIVKHGDGWDFDRGLVVLELRPDYHRRLNLDWLAERPAWFWVIGVKGVLLARGDVERLAGSAAAARLTSLDLADCDVRHVGVRAIVDSGRFARLARLRLDYARIGDEGAERLAQSSLSRLTVLSLFAAGVGPAGAQALANAANLTRLATLELGHNPLGQQGARALAGCSALPALTSLSLSGCQIGDRGALSLLHAPRLERLESLDVSNNGLTEAVKQELRERYGTRVTL